MADYYAEFAHGGFGLIITEGTYFDAAHSQAYPDQPAIVTEEQVRAWARVVDAVHEAGGTIFLQLMHAGALVQTGRAGRRALGGPAAGAHAARLRRRGAVPAAPRADGGRDRRRSWPRSRPVPNRRARPASTASRSTPPTATCSISSSRRTRTAARTPTPTARGSSSRCCEAIEALPVGLRISQLKVNDRRYRWDDPEALVRDARAGAARVRARGQRGRDLGGVLAAGLGRQPDRARPARVRRAGDRQRRPATTRGAGGTRRWPTATPTSSPSATARWPTPTGRAGSPRTRRSSRSTPTCCARR